MQINFGVTKGSFQGETVDLIVVRENDDPAIAVLHLDVTALAVKFLESHAL